MADTTTTNLGLTKPGVADAGGVNAWGGKLNTNFDTLDGIFKSDGTGTGVGLKAAASQVWNAILGTLKAAASRFQLVDATDNTKIATFDASGISTGTTRTYTLPNASGTLLYSGGALGTPASGDLSNATNYPGHKVGDYVLVFLTSDIAIGNATPTNLVNTGSIGANGQVWEVMGCACVSDGGAATLGEAAIHNGTSYVTAAAEVGGTSTWPANPICREIVTLTGATTFTLRAKGNSAGAGARASGLATLKTNKSTWIYARRIS